MSLVLRVTLQPRATLGQCVCVQGRGGEAHSLQRRVQPPTQPRATRTSEGTQLPPGAPGLTCRKQGHLLPSRARNPSSSPLLGRSIRTQGRTAGWDPRLKGQRRGSSRKMLLEESPLPSTVQKRPLAPALKPWEGVGARLEWVHALVYPPVLSLSHTHTDTDTYTFSHVTMHSHSYTTTDTRIQSRCGNSPGFRGIQVP